MCILPGHGVANALVIRCAPRYFSDLWGGPESAVGPPAQLCVADALVTWSAPGCCGDGPSVGAVLGIVSFLPAYVAGLSISSCLWGTSGGFLQCGSIRMSCFDYVDLHGIGVVLGLILLLGFYMV